MNAIVNEQNKQPDIAPVPKQVLVVDGPAPASPAPARRSRFRITLMLALPLALLLAGSWYWITGGRYVSTENAYVHQDMVSVSTEVAGRIVDVPVHRDQRVGVGAILFRIDDSAYRIALEKAESAVAAARLQVEQMRVAFQAATVNTQAARETLAYQQSLLARQEKLRNTGFNTQIELEKSKHEVNLASQALSDAEQAMAGAKAALGGDPALAADSHPVVQAALAQRDQARLDLDNTIIKAPVAGTVSQMDGLQVGEYVKVGTASLSIVQSDHSWVEANFNETDLEFIREGQPATLNLDSYPDLDLHGQVSSVGAGTGAVFSLLPAQNATGNWVKVVQRVPVRLVFTGPDIPLLRAGLSVSVSIDTGHSRHMPAFLEGVAALIGSDARAVAGPQS